jgi:polysaccharide biosynthesis protein PelA
MAFCRKITFWGSPLVAFLGSWAQEAGKPPLATGNAELSDPGPPVIRLETLPSAEFTEVPRRILVVYGHASPEKPRVYPMDTFASRRLQMILEYYGYELEYHYTRAGVPRELSSRQYAGIIFDGTCEFVYEQEGRWLSWALRAYGEKKRLLLLGGMPWHVSYYAEQLGKALGIGGLTSPLQVPKEVKITKMDPAMNFEATVKPRTAGFEHFVAPPNSRVFLQIEGSMPDGQVQQYDPIFSTDWGGAFTGTYMTYQASAEDQFSFVDPFVFVPAVFPPLTVVPDTTTRCGRRVFFAHIDGDGFETLSNMPGNRMAAEEVRDTILKKYPLPITASVIEAASRCVQAGLDPEKKGAYENLAREIFNLPNVQSGSHAYSHPFVWIPNDPDSIGSYERDNLLLVEEEKYPQINVEREVAGSLAYLSKELLNDKMPDCMLWSGNCRAGEAALASARKAGVESINGGDTIISKRHPAVAGISPRGVPWGGEFQVFAANQNEYTYTGAWEGPFYGGFSRVTETFEMTDQQRRLKPVNIYFHFYSGSKKEGLLALQHAFDWAMEQPLHALKAQDYTKSVRDARAARIFRKSDTHWLLSAGPHCRTWRLPETGKKPDLAASRGVVGWNTNRGQLYLHTDGRATTELILSDKPSTHLRLAEASGPVEIRELSPKSAKVTWRDFRPVVSRWAGLAAGTNATMRISGGKVLNATADSEGNLEFQLTESGEGELTLK